MNHATLPFPIYVNVSNQMLGMQTPGVTRGMWHGVHSRLSQVVMCHVMLESGAHWSGLPIHAISATHTFCSPEEACRWGAMGERITVTHLPMLAGTRAETKDGADGTHTGLVIDWTDHWATVPAEHKPLNVIAMATGPYRLLPNNEMRVWDPHLLDEARIHDVKEYRRIRTVYWR